MFNQSLLCSDILYDYIIFINTVLFLSDNVTMYFFWIFKRETKNEIKKLKKKKLKRKIYPKKLNLELASCSHRTT